jgi:hypothetical protein
MPPIGIRALAVVLAVLVVAMTAPAAALAQGAGDEQYADPFTNQGGSGHSKPHTSPGSNGNSGSRSGSGTAPSAAAPAPSTPATPAAAPASSSEANPATNTARGPQLPYSGYPAWPAALAGAVLLFSGTALRVSLARRT